jgi:hypothetical protein
MTWETKKNQWKDWEIQPKGIYVKQIDEDHQVVSRCGYFYLYRNGECLGCKETYKECLQIADLK